jgi:hypothetical protein
MNEGILKSAEESALDDVTARATELLELWRSLERDEHFDSLRMRGGQDLKRLEDNVDRLFEARRARGQLPQMGNVERAQIGAVTARIESLMTGSSGDLPAIEKLRAACTELLAAIDAALVTVENESTSDVLRALRSDGQTFCSDAES